MTPSDGAAHAASEEAEIITRFQQSEMWRWFQSYLLHRRDALFAITPKTDGELWSNRGAIQEITRLLHAPNLVVDFLRTKKSAQQQPHDSAASDKLLPAGLFSDAADDF